MSKDNFAGDTKVPLRSPLAGIEKKIIQTYVVKFPPWIEGWHLTLMTIAWSAGTMLFGYLAARPGDLNINWLWGVSLMAFLQWFTDSFDGALGRLRDFGIPKWGYHVDHLLDFVYMWCLPMSYVFLVSPTGAWLIVAIAFLYAVLEVNSFLSFAATNEFKITYLGVGPTEIRVFFILLNILLIYRGVGVLESALPWALVVSVLMVVIIAFRTQKYIWAIDMEEKRKRANPEE